MAASGVGAHEVTNYDPFMPELTPDLIVRAYQAGIFPMAESEDDEDVFWVCPEERGIIPLDTFHVSKSMRKALKTHPYTIVFDGDFASVIKGCASKGTDRQSTWINKTIVRLYGELFDRGIVHTVEVWDKDELVGGLYGLAIGGAFFGESMFHTRTNASKIALVHLVEHLRSKGFTLLDTQFVTEHLRSLGAIEIQQAEYEQMLKQALQSENTQF